MTVLSALLQITVYSAVIYAALMLFKSLFKKLASPRLQYLVWFLLIARLLIPVTPDAGFSFFTVPAQQNAAAPSDPIIEETSLNNILYSTEIRPLAYPVMNVPQTGLEPGQTDSPTQNQMNKAAFQFDWISILIMAWAAGAAVSMIRVARSFRRLSRLIGDSGPAPFMLYALAEKIKSEINVTSDVKIAVVDKAVSPALSAGLRPVVIIPRRMLWMGEEQLEFALRHELMHFKRKDYLVCLLLVFLRAVYWFNPVVWLAARQMKTDMEPACDSAAAAFMGGEEKKRYVNTILNMYTGKPNFVLGMALQNNARKTAESRIRGIFMSRRSKRGTKAAAVLLASVLAVACFTTACQPTPEKPVVVNKNDSALSDSLKATPAPEAVYDAPETFQKSFPAKDDRVTVNIDVAVDVPKVSAFPVVRIMPDEFPSDFVKKAADVLFEGKTAYEPRTQMTKPEIEKEILELQQALADPEHSKSDGLTSGDPDTVAMVTQMFEDRIKNYQALLAAAPDEVTPKESDFQFHPAKTYEDPAMYKEESDMWKEGGDEQSGELLDQYENGQRLIADATLDGGYYGRIDVSNYSGGSLRINTFSFFKSKTLNPNNIRYGPDFDPNAEFPATNISTDEAARMSQDLLDQLGITDMALTSCSPITSISGKTLPQAPEQTAGQQTDEVCGYNLLFQHTYGGIPTIYAAGNDFRQSNDDQYGPYYQHEYIQVTIYGDHIVSFMWQSPSNEAQTENANVELLPFDDIMNAFERQMSLEYTLEKLSRYGTENPDYDEYIAKMESGHVDISRIELGMVRMQVKDKPGEYRMVPAWNFYGNEKVKWKDLEEEQDNITSLFGSPNVYLTVSAIDGSVIDSALGY
jgi:beta-lactamase regulating signal transducer with metallopeptidase domain